MKELVSSFNNKVKEVRTACFSNLINCDKKNAGALFCTVDRLVNPASPPGLVFSNEDCEMFIRFIRRTVLKLLGFSNDILMCVAPGECSILLLLDLSAAFNTVDHSIFLSRLQEWVGITGTALDWFASYLSVRSCSVITDHYVSYLLG